MVLVRNLLVGFIAATALFSGGVAAETKTDPRTNPAPGSYDYGVIESIGPAPAPANPSAVVAVGSSTAAVTATQDIEKSQSTSGRFHIRVRLDDGRYQGFHQFGGDELRVGDRVQIESDRLRRAQEQGQTTK